MGGGPASVTRNIARAARKCWKSQEAQIREKVIGEPCEDMHAPRDDIQIDGDNLDIFTFDAQRIINYRLRPVCKEHLQVG